MDQFPLGTRLAALTRAAGPPLARYAQPVEDGAPLECLIYPGLQGENAYARFCFAGERLALASVVLGDQALEPAEVAPEGPVQTLEPGPPDKAGGSLDAG